VEEETSEDASESEDRSESEDESEYEYPSVKQDNQEAAR
jgi:hypothetical protein